jgi:hypothetical protein
MEKSASNLRLASPGRAVYLGIFLLSAATLTFEINLTRLFSVAQFYHFAFMIVSMALLGFGASGTWLAIFPKVGQKDPPGSLGRLSLAAGLCMLGGYLLINGLPFDSFSIAWDAKQVGVLAVHYLALAAPFFFSGLAVGSLLSAYPEAAGTTYAVNLLGSAAGCPLALVAPAVLGGEGTVVLSSGLAGLACLCATFPAPGVSKGDTLPALRWLKWFVPAILLIFAVTDLGLRLAGQPLVFTELRLSPYKGLAYALQYPGARVIYRRWNSFSRLDLVRSQGVRSLPGLSYRYLALPPAQDGLLIDGDELSPVVLPDQDPAFYTYLPGAIAYRLRPQATALVLEPRGGLDVLTALSLGAGHITAVEANPLIVEAARHNYTDPRLQVVLESDRSYIHRSKEKFDVVALSLASSYHPVRSGAYSLAEDYRYTVQAFQDALDRLDRDGLLVVTRWLQTPPSEELRLFALAVTALESSGGDPRAQIVAFRGYNTATILVKNGAFTARELGEIRQFAAERAFDLIFAPDIRPEETNRYNILPESDYYQTFTELLETRPRRTFYDAYPYEVEPPSDDRPFFGHFFKWSQAGQVLAELGKTWQPFGGAGYFVIVALLILASALAALLILLPAAVARRRRKPVIASEVKQSQGTVLLYFGLIGLAYLLVEIPLIQRFILFLSHPAYALTMVLFSLLLFSGLGSQASGHFPLRLALAGLVLLLLAGPALLPAIFEQALGLPLWARLVLTALILAPVGFLMGIPFAGGVRRLTSRVGGATMIPWIWAVNGAASVVASVLAALLALSLGFSWVLGLGAICYGGAWLTLLGWSRPSPALSPDQ